MKRERHQLTGVWRQSTQGSPDHQPMEYFRGSKFTPEDIRNTAKRLEDMGGTEPWTLEVWPNSDPKGPSSPQMSVRFVRVIDEENGDRPPF